MTWRRLAFEEGPAAELIEAGARLLDSLADDATPALRWYRATDTALVLGRGQRPELVSGTDLAVVPRFSGGGAVLMDPGLLCLDVLVPTGHAWLAADDLGGVFEAVGEVWAGALAALGVTDVEVHRTSAPRRTRGSDRERLIAAVCYATLGRGEVTAAGRKLVGLAQRRRRPGALVQCGLLRRWDPGPLLDALGADPADSDVRAAATGLDDLLENPPDDETVMTAVHDTLERVGGPR